MGIHNYMEDVAIHAIDEILNERKDICSCEQCKMDIIAWTLNRLPSKYVVTQKGRVYTKLQELEVQFKADVVKEVTQAINHIKDNLRH